MNCPPRTPLKSAAHPSRPGSEVRTAAALPRSLRRLSALKSTQRRKERQGREELVLVDVQRHRRRFAVLRDADLGLDRRFQTLVHPTAHDDDCETDEEQLDCSRGYCLTQLREGIRLEFGPGALEAGPPSPERGASPTRSDSASPRLSADSA
mgnify:CR=1 FL=1